MEREPLMSKKQLVQIKGTKDGIVLHLDDQCSYSELISELKIKVEESGIDGKIDVQLNLANRYCSMDQKKELVQITQSKGKMIVSKVTSNVMTVEECNQRMEEHKCETYVGIVRSGQTIFSKGDLLVIGDVNPNGKVTAVGNIYVLGKLKGMAHAGIEGKTESIIAASTFSPTHVAIASVNSLMTDENEVIKESKDEHLFAYLDETKAIQYDRIQEVRKVRPSLSMFKGGS